MVSFKFSTIRKKMTFWFLLLTLLPLFTVLVITYLQRTNAIQTSTLDKLIAIRDLKVTQLNNWLEERDGDSETFSTNKAFRDLERLIHKKEYSNQDLTIIENSRVEISNILKHYKAYKNILILNPINGKVIVSNKTYFTGDDHSKEDYFLTPLKTKHLFIKDIYFSTMLSSYAMTYSIPIMDAETHTKPVGILVLFVDLENSLYKMLLDRTGLGKTGETLIVNKNSTALNELRWYDNAPLNLQIFADPAVKASKGETGVIFADDYRNEKVLAAYTYIKRTSWGFVCKQDMYELNEPIRLMIINFAALFCLATFIITIGALKISDTLSKPIKSMYLVAQKMKMGDFSVRNNISGEDELGVLANEFDNMAEITQSKMRIQKSIAEISDTMVGKETIKSFANSLLKHLTKETEANMSVFYTLNEESMQYEHFISIGANEHMLSPFSANNPQGEYGATLSTKKIYHLKNIPNNTTLNFKSIIGEIIPREIITIPILIDDIVVALISLVKIDAFSNDCLEILQQSWMGINVSYSKLISNERTRVLAEHLSRMNQNLEAQTEELQEQSEELQNQAEELQRTSKELQEQNKELEKQKLQVEAANKTKSEFLSNMSHELRTPLNSIMALSRVLIIQAENKLDEEEKNYLEIVERNGKRLLTLINNILDLSKVESGKMDIEPKLISINNLLRIETENLYNLASEKGIELNFKKDKNLPEVETDENMLHQVLTNLIGNAVKFTNKGSVNISTQVNSETIEIDIADTGIGISKEMQTQIFEEFKQADGSTTRSYEGTGLGLAIAKKMTEALGGNISVKSILGQGSTFKIVLPIKWHLKPNAEPLLKPPLKTISTPAKAQKNKSEITILLIEDNTDTVLQMKMLLEREGYTILIANNGHEALDAIANKIPDGIISDLMMPGMDGFEVLENLRSQENTRNIPVLILTAKNLSKDEREKINALNVTHLIQKGNINVSELIQKVSQLIGKATQAIDKNDSLNEPIPLLSKTTDSKKNIKVLVIEDNPDNLVTIRAILKERFNILEANEAKIGLELAITENPNLILLDMSLPNVDGKTILKNLKTQHETLNIPVIAVTAQAMKGDKERFLKAGCQSYVSKPIDPDTLLNEISKLLPVK